MFVVVDAAIDAPAGCVALCACNRQFAAGAVCALVSATPTAVVSTKRSGLFLLRCRVSILLCCCLADRLNWLLLRVRI